MTKCESCKQAKPSLKTAVVQGIYYANICSSCLGTTDVSSNAAGFERRRGYEDNASDTVQPYDATGSPRAEFFRLYPDTARKVFTPAEIEQVKREI